MIKPRAKKLLLKRELNDESIFNQPKFRPLILISTVLLSIFFTGLIEYLFSFDTFKGIKKILSSSQFLGDLFFPTKTPDWKDKLTAMLPIIGLPVAFWLWYWRDQNAQSLILSNRKDVNLKEFQHVFSHSAGIFDNGSSFKSTSTAQIASLHHLRAFLKGEYGASFQRPAFELLLSGHSQAIIQSGLAELISSNHAFGEERKKFIFPEAIKEAQSRLSDVDLARMTIIREEHELIFGLGFPLTNRSFDLIDFSYGLDFGNLKVPMNTNFMSSTFVGTNLIGIQAAHCDFQSCDFSGADLGFSDLRGTRFWNANLLRTDLRQSDLRGANLATISPYSLHSCQDSAIDEETWLAPMWEHITEAERAERWSIWIEQGAEWVGSLKTINQIGSEE